MDLALLVARLMLAVVFAVAGTAKLADPAGSRAAVVGFGVPPRFAGTLGTLLPIAELVVAVALIPTATTRWGALGALALLLGFAAAIGSNLARGRTPDCHCFGRIHSAPAGWSTISRNGGLVLVAAFVAVGGWADPGASAVAWLGDVSGGEAALVAGGTLAAGVVTLVAWALLHLVDQNGRLLARLEAVERSIETGAAVATAEPRTVAAPADDQASMGAGLSVGTPAPAFALPDLHGAPTSLETLRAAGAATLLLFTDPNCGPCNRVLRQVGRWEDAFGDRLTIAVLSRGDRKENVAKAEEHGLSRLLIQPDPDVSRAYRAMATPTAVLVRADGTIGAPAAVGDQAIRRLIAGLMQDGPAPVPPAPVPPVRVPETTGPSVAPDFRLPDLAGREVALGDLRARGLPVVLLFTDPRCAPCDLMLPDLGRWQRDYADRVTIALVSTGTPATNRAKTDPYGIGDVLLQRSMEVIEAYGVTQAPAAVVVLPDGTRAGRITYGEPQIQDLMARVVDAPELRPVPVVPDPDLPSFAGPRLRVGDEIPSLELATVDGGRVDLGDLRGPETVLLFWCPSCGYCQRMADDLKTWEATRPAGSPRLVIVATDDPAATRARGFRSPVVLDPGVGIGRRFGTHGTPAAIRIDAEGRVASQVASGVTAVLGLLRAGPAAVSAGTSPEPRLLAAVASADGRGQTQ